MVISDEARAERNAYLRAWRAKNRDKVRAANSAYWERKAANKNSSTTDSIGKEAGDMNAQIDPIAVSMTKRAPAWG